MTAGTRKWLVIITASVAVVAIAVVLFFGRFSGNENVHVIVVNKSSFSFSEFWEAAYAGMTEAVEEYGVECEYMNALYEHEIDKQKLIIDEAIRKRPDVIVLSASDFYEIGPYAEKIIKEGIELVIFDSNVNITTGEVVPYVGTNSLKAGEYLGARAKEAFEDHDGNAIILSHYRGVQTADDRENGIRNGYGEAGIIDVFSCNAEESVAYDITKEQLTMNKDIEIIFATNENVTIGAAKAVEEMGLGGVISIYGFDGSKAHVQFLEKGIVDATVIQSPYQIGYLTIVKGIEAAKGEKIPGFIETDFIWIDRENMYDVGYREILFPFVNKN